MTVSDCSGVSFKITDINFEKIIVCGSPITINNAEFSQNQLEEFINLVNFLASFTSCLVVLSTKLSLCDDNSIKSLVGYASFYKLVDNLLKGKKNIYILKLPNVVSRFEKHPDRIFNYLYNCKLSKRDPILNNPEAIIEFIDTYVLKEILLLDFQLINKTSIIASNCIISVYSLWDFMCHQTHDLTSNPLKLNIERESIVVDYSISSIYLENTNE